MAFATAEHDFTSVFLFSNDRHSRPAPCSSSGFKVKRTARLAFLFSGLTDYNFLKELKTLVQRATTLARHSCPCAPTYKKVQKILVGPAAHSVRMRTCLYNRQSWHSQATE